MPPIFEDKVDPVAGLPVWARVIAWVGAPTAGLAFLLWWMTTSLSADIQATDSHVEQHIQSSTVTQGMIQDESNLHKQTIALLRQICVGISKTPDERRACVQ
jgi:hypothetical protein